MPHPEPPASCPFFRVCNGELEFSPSAFAVEHDEYNLSQDCFPAKRYASACVAMDWLRWYALAHTAQHKAWMDYCDDARAEMEASNG